MTGFRVEKLTRGHAVDAFDCGQEALNRFLVRYALANQQANASQTYVGLADDVVIGFHTLVVSEVAHADAPERMSRGLARHAVPVMLLARLAVSSQWQGRGVGAWLLRDAVIRTIRAADIARIRALVVHAKDKEARNFYRRFDFQDSPTDPLHLFALLKDLRNLQGGD